MRPTFMQLRSPSLLVGWKTLISPSLEPVIRLPSPAWILVTLPLWPVLRLSTTWQRLVCPRQPRPHLKTIVCGVDEMEETTLVPNP